MKTDIYNTERRYSVVYADPPWAYCQQGRGAATKHYGTMSTEDIASLPVRRICTDNALLFMWATFPNIEEAIKVMQGWGFEYKTAAFVWVKTNKKSGSPFWGMGSYTQANAEVCLLGISKKTKAGQQIKNHGIHQIITSPIEEHSKKPAVTRERIEALTGSEGAYIELFARQSSPGWDCWGNEAPKGETKEARI